MREESKLFILSISLILIVSQALATTTYTSPGSYNFNVPQSGQYEIRVWGAEGGDSSGAGRGAPGGYAEGKINLQASDNVYVYVGGQGDDAGSTGGAGGFNGGGDGGNAYNPAGNGGGGGGASDVRVGGTALGDRVIVGAGGGGGGGDRDENVGRGTGGGGGGGYYGGGAGSAADQRPHPTGGTQSSGGTGGDAYGGKSEDGSFGVGGDATNDNVQSAQFGSQSGGDGGVGGGLSGGDGGIGGHAWNGEGGGGGSSYVGGVSNSDTTAGLNTGDGRVEIELVTDPAPPSIQVPFGVNRIEASQSGPASLDFSVDVDIDSDGGSAPGNTLDSCSVTVTGQDSGGSYNPPTSITSGGSNGGTGTCEFSVSNDDNANWEPGEDVSVQVNVEDSYSGSHTVSRTESFVNTEPTVESVTPSDGAEDVWGGQDGVNVEVEVVDWESYHTNNDLDVELYDSSLGRFATDTVSNGQGSVSLDWERNGEEGMSGFDAGSSHQWEANIEDVSGTSLIQSQSFTVLNPVPNKPDSPQPSDEETVVSRDHNLQVTAHHPDGLDMDVKFYINDGDGYQQVGSSKTAQDGETISVDPNLNPGTQYNWKASATTHDKTRESTEWTFTTNYRPSVDSLEVKQLNSGHAVNLSAVVSDRDGGNQIDDCELSVTDDEGDSDSPVVVMRDGSSPNEVKCLVGRIDFKDSSWKHLELLDFNLTVNDDKGLGDHKTTSEKLPNNAPGIEAFDVVSYRDREAFSISSIVQFKDDGSSEIRSCSIVIDDGENSYSVGSMTRIDSSKARCEVDNVGPDRFSGIRVDEELEILVRATDSHGKTGTFKTLYNVPTGIDYDYTAMMLQSGGIDFVDYTVSNNADGESDFRTTIEGVNATFISNGQSEIEYSLSQSQTNSFRVKVSPEIGEYRTKQMKIVTENLNTGIKQVDQMPVDVRRNTQPTENTVPGISLIQILALISIAGLIYVRRL